ncbi:hypothetical protein WA026_008892 [Henosepilachna vigintioctopunctata]|uniref:non-specific serine/threonine protein kinase n=1 Tax=Henosepilachna vigintioctopunctata TaxID=420089 RepID=A0AAW1V606_9CUCU
MSKRKGNYQKKRSTTKLKMDLDLDIFKPPKMTISPNNFITKRELATQNIVPACPIVPPKLRRCHGRCAINIKPSYGQAKLLTISSSSEDLSSLYGRDLEESYFDQVFYRKFKMGEGSFGCVYKAICRDDEKLYAIKHFNSNHPKSSKYLEVENMEKLGSHRNILKLFMAWEEGENVYIKMECCQMSLAQYSKLNHNIPESQLHEILYDVIQGLSYIHLKNYIHLDVKPDNILMEKGHYKLGDFGLLYSVKMSDKIDRSSSEGDSKYLAPEILNGHYTPKADVFALGVTILELATDYVMPSNGCIWHAIRAGGVPANLSEKISSNLMSLICKMIEFEVNDRPTSSQILNCSIVISIMNKDEIAERTDYARLIAVGSASYPNILSADMRRVLNDIADSPGDMFQTPVNRTVTRKIAFSPSGDGIPRRMNPRTGSPLKDFRRSPRMKLFV